MSFQAMAWASEQTTGSATRKSVLYALANHANSDGFCVMSVDMIAAESELGSTAVKNALADMTPMYVVRKRQRRSDGRLGYYEFQLSLETRGVPRPETRGVSQGLDLDQDLVQDQEQDLKPSPAKPSKAEKDSVWDALQAVFGVPTTPQHRRRFGKVQKELLADTSLAPAAVAAEVPARAARYRAKWPDCELTLEALAKHWPDLRGSGAASLAPAWIVLDSEGIPVELLSQEDYREWRRTASPMENAMYQQRFDVADDGLPA